MTGRYTDTLIIGAGPAGLACAMELSKARKDFIVLEKSSQVGGLSKTYSFTEPDGLTFYTDNGPHRFFSRNPYLYSFIEEIIGEEWIKVRRRTRQYIDGKFYDYPLNLRQALSNMGAAKSFQMGCHYVWARLLYGVFRKPIRTFEDYAIGNFGKSLAEFNILNYTEKIWGVPANEIHPDWAAQRIMGLSVGSILSAAIRRVLHQEARTPTSLVDVFYYPSRGTGLIYESILAKIRKQGYQVHLNANTTGVEFLENGKIQVGVTLDGEQVSITCAHLVQSIPITQFVPMMKPPAPREVYDALGNLRYRNQVYLFITLNKERITDDQWIYFPSKATDIARISEMRNFSRGMSPEGKTSLFVEFFCFENDRIWNMSRDDLLSKALDLLGGRFISVSDIREVYVLKANDVYPIYDMTYREHLNTVKRHLNQFENLFYIGRPGRFRYNNQDHSLEMGIRAAQTIIDGTVFDMDTVGAEKEYYEKATAFPSASYRASRGR